MIPTLYNRSTRTRHLATPSGDPWCGTRVDGRLIAADVSTVDEINCAKCSRAEILQTYRSLLYTMGDSKTADLWLSIVKPPRDLSSDR